MSEKSYQLSGEVITDWFDSEEQALADYNAAVERHNLRYQRKSRHYAFLDRIPWGNGGCYETLSDGTVRHQWPNPTHNHGMIYLEIRTVLEKQYRLYECGICGCLHPWDWDDDCRDDANRYKTPEEYAEKIGVGVDDIEISDWLERTESDLLGV